MLLVVLFVLVTVLSVVFRIASALGLTIPLLYGILAPTLFSSWFYAKQPLAEGIGYALIALVALSWVISLIGKIAVRIQERREDKAACKLFLYRMRQARARGEDTVSTEGLWR